MARYALVSYVGLSIVHLLPIPPRETCLDNYTPCSNLMFDNNFGICGPIFKILSPGC